MEDHAEALAYMRNHGIPGAVNTALIVSRALDRGIDVQPTHKGRIRLQSGARSVDYYGGWLSLNSRLATRCAKDKLIAARLLRTAGLSAPQNAYFEPDDVRLAWSWAETVLPVVVKPAAAKKGAHVHLDIAGQRSFRRAFRRVAAGHGGVLVETFATGVEHRVTVVDGRAVAATRREPANVIGDGRSTIEALVECKNQERATRGLPRQWRIRVNQPTIRQLDRQQLTLASVPDAGTRVQLRATSNLSTGGDAIDATYELTDDELAMAEHAVHAFPDLHVAGVDILLPRRTGDDAATVLEVNGSPGLAMHHYPWVGQPHDVTSTLLDTIFPRRRSRSFTWRRRFVNGTPLGRVLRNTTREPAQTTPAVPLTDVRQ